VQWEAEEEEREERMRRERATRDYHKIIIISGNRAASMALHVSCNEMYTIPLQRKKKTRAIGA
jgi:hypothetical protein